MTSDALQQEPAGILTFLPTVATLTAAAIAVLLLVNAGGPQGREHVAQPREPVTRTAGRVLETSDEFIWYVVDRAPLGDHLRKALAISEGPGGDHNSQVVVVRTPEEEAMSEAGMRELNGLRWPQGLPEVRVVDLRSPAR